MSSILKRTKSLFSIKKNDTIFVFFISFVVCLIDLITKCIVFSLQYEGIYICPILNILKVRNYGISFGLFSRETKYVFYIIFFLNITIIIYLIHMLKMRFNYKYPNLFKVSISFIIGGALGNLIDRLYYGNVRDFIDIHLNNIHWPCFNVADTFICIGLAMMIVCEWLYHKKSDNNSTKLIKGNKNIK